MGAGHVFHRQHSAATKETAAWTARCVLQTPYVFLPGVAKKADQKVNVSQLPSSEGITEFEEPLTLASCANNPSCPRLRMSTVL